MEELQKLLIGDFVLIATVASFEMLDGAVMKEIEDILTAQANNNSINRIKEEFPMITIERMDYSECFDDDDSYKKEQRKLATRQRRKTVNGTKYKRVYFTARNSLPKKRNS